MFFYSKFVLLVKNNFLELYFFNWIDLQINWLNWILSWDNHMIKIFNQITIKINVNFWYWLQYFDQLSWLFFELISVQKLIFFDYEFHEFRFRFKFRFSYFNWFMNLFKKKVSENFQSNKMILIQFHDL